MTRQSGVDSTHTDLGVWQSRNMATVEMSTSDMFRSRVCCRIRRGLEEPGADMVTFSLVTDMWVETAWLQTCRLETAHPYTQARICCNSKAECKDYTLGPN